MKYIKSSGLYKFIRDIEDFKKICGAFLILKGEKIRDVSIQVGYYNANIDRVVRSKIDPDRSAEDEVVDSNFYSIQNDFDVHVSGGTMTSEYATELFRKYQTKTIGKEYVDALEEYLTRQTNKEIQKYRKLLEDEAE